VVTSSLAIAFLAALSFPSIFVRARMTAPLLICQFPRAYTSLTSDRECHLKHWDEHKVFCKAAKEAKKSSNGGGLIGEARFAFATRMMATDPLNAAAYCEAAFVDSAERPNFAYNFLALTQAVGTQTHLMHTSTPPYRLKDFLLMCADRLTE
jgi:hypothetical protein